MDRHLIVADDFTGANDTGVQMRRRGISTTVIFGTDANVPQGDSLVVDTESRVRSAEEAEQAVLRCMAGLDLSQFRYVIKKVDSTLRGNVGYELRALDRMYQSELVIFMPALPDMGRTTVNGVHCLYGVPISQTELARDPKNPVREDNLIQLLSAVYDEPVFHIPVEKNIDFSEGRLYACDAATNEDMKRIITAARATGKRILWVGTAAIADNLFELDRKTLPSFGVAGSVSSTTRRQLHYAAEKGAAMVEVSAERVFSEQPESLAQRVVASLEAGRDTILLSASAFSEEALAQMNAAGEAAGYTSEQVGNYLQALLGETARLVLQRTQVSGMFITGGDTAWGFLDKVGAKGSSILGEILVGIPMMRLVGGPCDGLKMVTKAGAFGGEDAISFAMRKLKDVVD